MHALHTKFSTHTGKSDGHKETDEHKQNLDLDAILDLEREREKAVGENAEAGNKEDSKEVDETEEVAICS